MKTSPDISVCVKTDVGFRRTNNEDACQLVYRDDAEYDVDTFGRMFAVADGMGGHAGGEVASRVACQVLLEYYTAQSETGKSHDPVDVRLDRLNRTFWRIENEISRLSEEMPRYANMGTTLSVLLLFRGHALIAHVGDSRIYRMRNGVLEHPPICRPSSSLTSDGATGAAIFTPWGKFSMKHWQGKLRPKPFPSKVQDWTIQKPRF